MSSPSSKLRIGVIGAGVIGMPCAYRLQTELTNTQVTVVAEEFSPDLTSDGAAGIYEIYSSFDNDPDRLKKWGMITYGHLKNIALSCDSIQAGVTFINWTTLSRRFSTEPPWYADLVDHYQKMSSKDVQARGSRFVDGYSHTTFTCEPRIYLPWMTKRFINAGGMIVQRKVTDLSKFCESFDLVVNCSGLGAATLANDSNMIPISGQLVRVKGIKLLKGVNSDDSDGTVMKWLVVPGRNWITLGGNFRKGNYNREIDEKERQRIMDECCKLEPRLKDATFDSDWCGLRPFRTGGVRLEVDPSYHPTTRVIHNYGHAGTGISLHWGCAEEVLQLTRQCLAIPTVNKSKL